MAERLRFVFVTPCVVEEFFGPVRRGADDAAEALGVEVDFTGTEEVDIPAQAAMVRQAVEDGYDGIALSICDPTAFNGPVADALDAGVPVVAFNIDDRSGGNPRLAGVCQDLRGAGRTIGRLLADRLDAGGTVLVTKHSAGVSALEERVAGIQEELEAAGIGTDVIVSGMFADEARAPIAAALDVREYVGIAATGQADTEGAGLVVEQGPRDGRVPIAGFDLSDGILRLVRNGTVVATVDQQPYVQGFYPLTQLVHAVRYGLAPSDLDAGATLVTAANVDEVADLCAAGYR